MRRSLFVFLSLILFFAAGRVVARAQPRAGAAVNAASFLNSTLPNGKLAQGAMFTVFGAGLGPDSLRQVFQFPLRPELAGTSIQVTAGGETLDCLMIFTVSTQAAAILPSATPAGPATLTVSFNGESSAPLEVEIVPHNFGIFAINNAGSGPGVFTDVDFRPNTLFQSANPGSIWNIWGTGVGPVDSDEAAVPAPADLVDIDVEVFLGGRPAPVLFRGRSGCCAGVDQIQIEIPEGIAGCFIPVVVVVEGVPGNYTTISIAENGRICSDPAGPQADALAVAEQNGRLRLGNVLLSRIWTEVEGLFSQRGDTAFAFFGEVDIARTIAAPGEISAPGACVVNQTPEFNSPTPAGLDAGPSVNLAGPFGSVDLAQSPPGVYLINAVGAALSPPGAQQGPAEPFLDPGIYTFTGTGGSEVGAFSAQIDLPEAIEWTNRNEISSIDRGSPLEITWSNAAPGSFVQVEGFSPALPNLQGGIGARFRCLASAEAGSFAVPREILQALPPSADNNGFPEGELMVGTRSFGTRFDAPGIDVGIEAIRDVIIKTVDYQ